MGTPEAVVSLPAMTAAEIVTVIAALTLALHHAQAAQAQSSKASAANAPGRKHVRESAPEVVPVAIAANVFASARRLDQRGAALKSALPIYDGATAKLNRGQRRIFQSYQRAWRAVRDLFAVWAAAEALDDATREAIRAAMAAVFGVRGDLLFARTTDRRAWAAGDVKLSALESAPAHRALSSIGGELLARHLRAVHDALGASLGVTAPSKKRIPRASAVPAAMRAALREMRDYVLKVRAMVDPDVPGSDALAGQLLDALDVAPRAKKAAARATTAGAAETTAPVLRATGT